MSERLNASVDEKSNSMVNEDLKRNIDTFIEIIRNSEEDDFESILALVKKIIPILDKIHIKDCGPISEAIYNDDKIATNLFFIIHTLLQNVENLDNNCYLMLVSFLNILREEFVMTLIETYPESLDNLCNISLDNIYNFSKVFNSVLFLARSDKNDKMMQPIKSIFVYINDLIKGFKKKLVENSLIDKEKLKSVSIDSIPSLALDLYKKTKENPSTENKESLKSCIDIYRYYKFLDEVFYFLRVDKPGNFAHYISVHLDDFILSLRAVSKKNRIESMISTFVFLDKDIILKILLNTDLGNIFGYYQNCNVKSIISGYITKFLRNPNLKNADIVKLIASNNAYLNYLPKGKIQEIRKILGLEETYQRLKSKNPSKIQAVENKIFEMIFDACKEKISIVYTKKVIESNIATSVVGVSQKNYIDVIKDYIKKNSN